MRQIGKTSHATVEKDVKYVRSYGVFIIDFEHILDLFLVFLLFAIYRWIFFRNFFFFV